MGASKKYNDVTKTWEVWFVGRFCKFTNEKDADEYLRYLKKTYRNA